MVANRPALRAAGVVYPGDSPHSHFRAALDLRGATFGGHDYPKARGAWAAVTAEVNAFPGAAVISHESLARTRRAGRVRAVEDFAGAPVHVVITARDLTRQIPAVWQEQVKNRNTTSYAAYLEDVFTEGGAERFWRAQDLPGVAARWAEQVGGDAVTIVTVPRPGAHHSELWNRFREACALPDVDVVIPDVDNRSMGAAESELLRQINTRLPSDLPWPRYEARIKRRFAPRVLSSRREYGTLVLPDRWRDAVTELAGSQVETLAAAGYRVVGDLDDLMPVRSDSAPSMPDDFTSDQLLAVSIGLLADVALLDEPPGTAATSPPAVAAAPDTPGGQSGQLRRWSRRFRG